MGKHSGKAAGHEWQGSRATFDDAAPAAARPCDGGARVRLRSQPSGMQPQRESDACDVQRWRARGKRRRDAAVVACKAEQGEAASAECGGQVSLLKRAKVLIRGTKKQRIRMDKLELALASDSEGELQLVRKRLQKRIVSGALVLQGKWVSLR
jgi:hypothetical protein